MGKDSITRKILIVFLFSVGVPVLISAILIHKRFQNLVTYRQLTEANSVRQAKALVVNTLQRIEAGVEIFTQSREVVDFLHATAETKLHLENFVYGRWQVVQPRIHEIDEWQLVDDAGRSWFGESAELLTADEDGFFAGNKPSQLIFRKTIAFDDQDLATRSSATAGRFYARVDLDALSGRSANIDLAALLADILENDHLQPLAELDQHQPQDNVQWDIVILLSIMVLASAGGIVAMKREVIVPLRRMDERTAELKRLEAIAKMTQMIAHDVKRPFTLLQMVLSHAKMEKDPAALQAFAQKFLPMVEESLRTVSAMLADITQIGKPHDLIKKPVSLHELIRATLETSLKDESSDAMGIDCRITAKHLPLGDDSKLQRVLGNLVDNAIEATRDFDRRITVGVRDAAPGVVHFSVANNGPRVEADSLPHLFDPFYTRHKRGGTGLGLAICKQLVEAHGGEIWCESSDEQTLFHFTVPASDVIVDQDCGLSGSFLPDETLDHCEDKIRGTANSLLVVDDEDIFVETLRHYVRDLPKLHLIAAKSCESALAIASNDIPLIIMDIDLGPNSPDGFATIRALRARGYRGKICIHSNHGSFQYRDASIESGADMVVPKTMTRQQLLRMIGELI